VNEPGAMTLLNGIGQILSIRVASSVFWVIICRCCCSWIVQEEVRSNGQGALIANMFHCLQYFHWTAGGGGSSSFSPMDDASTVEVKSYGEGFQFVMIVPNHVLRIPHGQAGVRHEWQQAVCGNVSVAICRDEGEIDKRGGPNVIQKVPFEFGFPPDPQRLV
jgi:hypothetical protein